MSGPQESQETSLVVTCPLVTTLGVFRVQWPCTENKFIWKCEKCWNNIIWLYLSKKDGYKGLKDMAVCIYLY